MSEVCVRSNITKAGRARRTRLSGIVALAIPFVTYALRLAGVKSTGLSVTIGLMAMVASFVYLQVHRSVCAVLALKGAREKGDADHFEKIQDQDEIKVQKAVAFTILRDSAIAGVVIGVVSSLFL